MKNIKKWMLIPVSLMLLAGCQDEESTSKASKNSGDISEQANGTIDLKKPDGSIETVPDAGVDLDKYEGIWGDKDKSTETKIEFEHSTGPLARVKVSIINESSTDWKQVRFQDKFGILTYQDDMTGNSGTIEFQLEKNELWVTINSNGETPDTSALPTGAYKFVKEKDVE